MKNKPSKGQLIKARRKHRMLTQEELGEAANLSRKEIIDIEHGRPIRMTPMAARLLSIALKVTPGFVAHDVNVLGPKIESQMTAAQRRNNELITTELLNATAIQWFHRQVSANKKMV